MKHVNNKDTLHINTTLVHNKDTCSVLYSVLCINSLYVVIMNELHLLNELHNLLGLVY